MVKSDKKGEPLKYKHSESYLAKYALFANGLKQCIKCGEIKPLSEFTTDKSHFDGHHPYCYKCVALAHAKRYKETPNGFKASVKRWENKNPDKKAAHNAINLAVKTGKLIRPDACSICGNNEVRIIAHHTDSYEEEHWLDVIWVCDKCHNKIHMNLEDNSKLED